jgi:chitinase
MNGEKKVLKRESRCILALILTVLISLGSNVQCLAVDVNLQWNPNTEDDLAGYKVYYKADSSTPPFNGTGAAEGNSPIDVGLQSSAALHNLNPARDWSFTVTAYDSSGNESGYALPVSIKESVAPKVSLTSPVKNSVVRGTVKVTARATDNRGVTNVEFYVNNVLKVTVYGPPYSYKWDSTAVDNGPCTIYAKAYDAANNFSQSTDVTVKVNNDKTSPVVNITSPLDASTVKGIVTVRARATDNVRVTKVEFYVNNVLKKTDMVAPYSYSWNTGNAANGSTNTLTAKAYDRAGNVGESAVTVTVNR